MGTRSKSREKGNENRSNSVIASSDLFFYSCFPERTPSPLPKIRFKLFYSESKKFVFPKRDDNWKVNRPFMCAKSPIDTSMERKFSPIVPEHPPNATSTQKRLEFPMEKAEKRKLEKTCHRNLNYEFSKLKIAKRN